MMQTYLVIADIHKTDHALRKLLINALRMFDVSIAVTADITSWT